MNVLCGDIGGTNTRLAFVEVDDQSCSVSSDASFPSQKFESLQDIIAEFLNAHKASYDSACFGVAGPVQDGRCKFTNLPWVIDVRSLAQAVGVEEIFLLNDLEANAYGIPALDQREFLVLNKGSAKAEGNAVVISAGTALGEAGLFWDGQKHRAIASEGGHADFSPSSSADLDLYRYLAQHFEKVSWERVLSGPGIVNLYRFVCETKKASPPVWLEKELNGPGGGSAVTQAGVTGKCGLCSEAIDLFVRHYGAEAGNFALKILATGGVYLGGGIAPKITEKLKGPLFMEAFLGKSKMRHILETMPVKVLLNERTALLGAARYAKMRHKG